MTGRIDYVRIILIVAGVIVGVVVFCLSTFLPAFNHNSLGLLVTAFSVLAGIMIAIITMLGDPANLYRGSWRMASLHRRQIRRRFFRYEILFYAYLIVIGLACAAAVIDGVVWPETARWLARVALALGAATFIWSLGLPRAIIRTQMDRIGEEVERRRAPKEVASHDSEND